VKDLTGLLDLKDLWNLPALYYLWNRTIPEKLKKQERLVCICSKRMKKIDRIS
jgi:hypothetical protein